MGIKAVAATLFQFVFILFAIVFLTMRYINAPSDINSGIARLQSQDSYAQIEVDGTRYNCAKRYIRTGPKNMGQWQKEGQKRFGPDGKLRGREVLYSRADPSKCRELEYAHSMMPEEIAIGLIAFVMGMMFLIAAILNVAIAHDEPDL